MHPLMIIIPVLFVWLLQSVRILKEYERGVVFRLGRVLPETKGPGLVLIFWPIDTIVIVSTRIIVMDVPSQDIITRDNVSVKVNAVLYFRVLEAIKAKIEVEDYLFATSQLAQTTLRSVLGQSELDELLADREKINLILQELLDKQTDAWGIKISAVELKHVDLPQEMQRAMAKQAEAERERRAKVIHAQGESQASFELLAAAQTMEKSDIAIQLRYLQTLTEIATEKNSTIVFPLPVTMLKNLVKDHDKES